MIKAAAFKENGESVVVLGITRGNIARLTAGDPIHAKLTEEIGKPADEVFIIFGETEEDLYNMLKRYMTPETKINVDPRLKDIVT